MDKETLSSNMEDYLEAIYIIETKNKVARITEIADHLSIKKPSVTKALKQLGEMGLVNYEPYKYITLTVEGTIIALKILSKHKVLKLYFTKIMMLKEEDADTLACSMEHFVTCEQIKNFKNMIDFFNQNPQILEEWDNFEIPNKEVCK